MTFNIRHGLGLDGRVDLKRIENVIAQSGTDVITLQEVDRFMARSGNQDQITKLAIELNMEWRYAASIRHGRSEYGNAVLSRCPIVESDVTVMPGELERRSLLQVQLDTEIGNIIVLTTHLGVSDRDRLRQVPLLMNQLQKINSPAILMGDFNMEADHALMQQIGGLGWQHVQLAQNNVGTGTVLNGATIDHIYVYDWVCESESYTIGTTASDHLPVVVEIS